LHYKTESYLDYELLNLKLGQIVENFKWDACVILLWVCLWCIGMVLLSCTFSS